MIETSPFSLTGTSASLFWLVIKVVIYLVFLGALMWLFLWIFKRKKLHQEIGFINTIGIKTVAPGKYINIVEIGGKILILGIGESITLLSEISDKETIDLIKTQASKEEGEKNPNLPFVEYLKNFRKKMDFLDKQKERLKSM